MDASSNDRSLLGADMDVANPTAEPPRPIPPQQKGPTQARSRPNSSEQAGPRVSSPRSEAAAATQSDNARPDERQSVEKDLISKLMAAIISPLGQGGVELVERYRDDMLRDAGNPTDPLERVLIEQVVVLRVVSLFKQGAAMRAMEVGDHELYEVYSAAAGQSQAELRRSVLAVKEYRTPPVRPIVNKIEQQNVAESQKVQYVASKSPKDGTLLSCKDEQTPKGRRRQNPEISDASRFDTSPEVPCASGRGTAQPAATGSAH
jgi:hypothetical protein